MKAIRSTALAAVALLALGALAGCGDDDGGSGGGGSTDASVVTEATDAIEAAYKGLYTEPTEGGPKAQTGKDVWVISCFQALPGCSEPTAGVVEAAKELGWTTKVADGGATPAGYDTAIRQAIAAKPDGIITVAIDCPSAKSALQAAKDAKIPTVGVYAYDCDDPKADAGPALYTALINSNGTPADFGTRWGKLRAQYAIKATEGKAQIIQTTHPDFLISKYEDGEFAKEIEKCGGCEIVSTLPISAADLGDPATTAQKIATVLQQYPTANVLQVSSDTLLLEVAQAIKAANRKDLVVIGGEGYAATLDLVRSGVASVAVAIPANWLGWEGADALNRVLAGETEIPNQGANFQVIDADNGLPGEGEGWTPSVDYKAAFIKNWKG